MAQHRSPKERRIGLIAELTAIQAATLSPLESDGLAARNFGGVGTSLSAEGIENFALFLACLPGRDCLFAFGKAVGLGGNAGFPALESVVEGLGTVVWVEAEEVFRMEGARSPASAPQCRSVGTVTGLRPEKEFTYRALHANPWPAVIEQTTRAGFRDYSVFLQEIAGQLFLFSHFLRGGNQFDRDVAEMGKNAACRRWWKYTGECISPFPDAVSAGRQWSEMKSGPEMNVGRRLATGRSDRVEAGQSIR